MAPTGPGQNHPARSATADRGGMVQQPRGRLVLAGSPRKVGGRRWVPSKAAVTSSLRLIIRRPGQPRGGETDSLIIREHAQRSETPRRPLAEDRDRTAAAEQANSSHGSAGSPVSSTATPVDPAAASGYPPRSAGSA